MNTAQDCLAPANVPNQSSSALAARIDNAWFDTHLDATAYTRDIIAAEVPSWLKSKCIRKVRCARISGGVILYQFADRRGNAVGHSLHFPEGFLTTEEGRAQASVCLKLVNSLASLGSEDE
jgi:hypothetical protein